MLAGKETDGNRDARSTLIIVLTLVVVVFLSYSAYLIVRGPEVVTTTELRTTTITESTTVTSTIQYTHTATETTTSTYTATSTATETTTSTTTHTTTLTTTYTTTSTVTHTPLPVSDPIIVNGKANITYPVNYTLLANYALETINEDRAKFGLTPVTLSPIPSAQQHANSMLYFGYVSHWDTQGYKPYMRYTLLGGTGAVEENAAANLYFGPYLTTNSLEQSLKNMENDMMYNDTACCNNAHRINILNPYHNRVSIGIAYNSSHLYYVQDFENYFFQLSEPIYSNGNVRLVGSASKQILPNLSIYIYYDNSPAPLSVSTLWTGIYTGAYDQGQLIGGVLPPCSSKVGCPFYQGIITGYALTWQNTTNSVNIQFTLKPFIDKYGKGAYTIYLLYAGQRPFEEYTSITVLAN